MSLKFRTAQLSQKGGRDTNEDYCESLSYNDSYCWVVADGLGGHSSGEVASRTAVKSIIESFKNNQSLKAKTIKRYIEDASTTIAELVKNYPEKAGMMTTVVVMISDAKKAIWGHVGDSRLYMFRDGRVFYQTKDHSLVQRLLDSGEITQQEMRSHPDRNRLLSAIGGESVFKTAILDEPIELEKGDSFLLCTDGIWEYISEIEMIADLARAQSPDDWLKQLQVRVLSKATDRHDNYTAIAIMID